MPGTVSQVADGIKTRLQTITGLRVYNYQPEQLNPPVAYPSLNSVTYHKAFGGGLVEMNWTILVIVGRYLDRVAHETLDGYLSYSGATSVRAAIEGDKTLGGVADTLILSDSTDISSLSSNDAEFLQIELSLTVHA